MNRTISFNTCLTSYINRFHSRNLQVRFSSSETTRCHNLHNVS